MDNIQTTGGLFTPEIKRIIEKNICSVFTCTPDDIEELIPVQAGMTNIVLSINVDER